MDAVIRASKRNYDFFVCFNIFSVFSCKLFFILKCSVDIDSDSWWILFLLRFFSRFKNFLICSSFSNPFKHIYFLLQKCPPAKLTAKQIISNEPNNTKWKICSYQIMESSLDHHLNTINWKREWNMPNICNQFPLQLKILFSTFDFFSSLPLHAIEKLLKFYFA